jgi:hypothetical protein
MMKKLYFSLLAVFLLTASACQRSDVAKELLQDEDERRQVYHTILENEQMRNEMMVLMRERNMQGPMGMDDRSQDSIGMADMHRRQMQTELMRIMSICDTDTAACNLMSQTVLQNRVLMGSLLQNLQRDGNMSANCLQELKSQVRQ